MKHKLVIMLLLISLLALALPVATHASDYASGACTQWYTVRYGDALYKIAWRYGTTTAYLAQINNLYNPNWIYAGQVLCVRTGGYSGNVYIVQYGDTLFRIAQRFGVNIYSIAQSNNLLNLNRIFAGQRLIIPGY